MKEPIKFSAYDNKCDRMSSIKILLALSDSVSSRVSRVLRKATSNRLSAFTLAELVVVMAILAILATVGFVALS